MTLVILWYVCWQLFDKRLSCPAIVIMTGYLFCAGTAFLSDFVVEFDYHWITYIVVVVNIALFIVISYICRAVFERKTVAHDINQGYSLYVAPWVLRFHGICAVLCFVVCINLFIDILSSAGIDADFFSAIPKMRDLIVNNVEIFNDNRFLFVNQIKKIFTITGYIFSVIWCRNCILKKTFRI